MLLALLISCLCVIERLSLCPCICRCCRCVCVCVCVCVCECVLSARCLRGASKVCVCLCMRASTDEATTGRKTASNSSEEAGTGKG